MKVKINGNIKQAKKKVSYIRHSAWFNEIIH